MTAGVGPAGGRDADHFPSQWPRIALGGGGGMFVAMGLGRFSYTAMVPALVAAGTLTPTEAGAVGAANFIGFFLGAAASVSVGRWLVRRQLLIGAVLLAVAGLIGSAIATEFAGLAVCRGAIGLATGIVMVNSLALIAETAPQPQRALAGSFVFAGVGFGIFASGTLVPWLSGFGLAVSWWALAMAGAVGAGVAIWGWWSAPPPPEPALSGTLSSPFGAWSMRGLLLAHFLFSAGIVPHSLYWVDFLARELGLGLATGGLHWSIAGTFAFVGPLACAAVAQRVGTGPALAGAFVLLGLGIAAPGLWQVAPILLASSVLFGAQPGLSALMAARARDLGSPDAMGRVMRAMILANAMGAVAGGLLLPWCLAVLGQQAPLFLIGGAAMLVAAVAAFPYERAHRAA